VPLILCHARLVIPALRLPLPANPVALGQPSLAAQSLVALPLQLKLVTLLGRVPPPTVLLARCLVLRASLEQPHPSRANHRDHGPHRAAASVIAPRRRLKPATLLQQAPLRTDPRALYLVRLATRALRLLLLVNRVALGRRLRDALS